MRWSARRTPVRRRASSAGGLLSDRTADVPAGSPRDLASVVVAVGLSAIFVVLALPLVAVLLPDFDESWLMLDARFLLRGARPFVDFAHHEMPLHVYVLALFGKLFGATVFGYRLAALASVAASGFLVFALARPFVGPVPALIAQSVFLFSPLQSHALTAVPESPMVACTLLGAWCLFACRRPWAAYASGAAFVLALMIKPTCLPMVAAAALSLVWAREWRRLGQLAVAGVVGAGVALAWASWVSDGVFVEVLRFQLGRIGTRGVGMWSIDSGFADMRQLTHVATPWQLAVHAFREFYSTGTGHAGIAPLVLGLLALPMWIVRCGRAHPAMAAFALLWPASWFAVNFVALDFVSMRYFVPFPAFAALLVAGWPWLAERWLGVRTVAAAGAVAALVLASDLRPSLAANLDPWYWGRLDWIARETPSVVSFSAMLFAASGAEPGCGLANAALTYGGFGEAWLLTERTRQFRFSDERLIACLRARPDMPIVVDWAFYFFTRPGGPLRQYLAGEGSGQRLFFSPEAVEQWDRPLLQMSPLR